MKTLAAALCLLAWAGPARGAGDRCEEDRKVFCADAAVEGGAVLETCMRAHMYEMSDACRERLLSQLPAPKIRPKTRAKAAAPAPAAPAPAAPPPDAPKPAAKHRKKTAPALVPAAPAAAPAPARVVDEAAVLRVEQSCPNEKSFFCRSRDGAALLSCLASHEEDAGAVCRKALKESGY